MPQQPLASTQLAPDSGGEMVTGLRLSTVVGAIVSVIVGRARGGCGCGRDMPMMWLMSAGIPAASSTLTSSHISAVCAGPIVAVGTGVASGPMQYARPVPDTL